MENNKTKGVIVKTNIEPPQNVCLVVRRITDLRINYVVFNLFI